MKDCKQTAGARRFGRKTILSLLSFAALCVPSAALAADSDGDTIDDQFDAFPCDPMASGVVFAPAKDQHAMLLFEDQWPSHGDLDFNDAAISYNYIITTNAQGKVLAIRLTVNALAVGGLFNNGLALHLPVPADSVAVITKRVQSQQTALAPDIRDTDLVVQLSPNIRELFGNASGQINSDPNQVTRQGTPMDITIRFSTPVTLDLTQAPFDLYIFRSGLAGYQIHRPEYPGTSFMDQSLFHTGDDGSSAQRHFVDRDGLPFVLNLPSLTLWPQEGVSVEHLFPRISQFASSGGTQAQDFYTSGVQTSYGFQHGSDGHAPATPSFVGSSAVPADTGCLAPAMSNFQFGTAKNDSVNDSVLDSNNDVIIVGATSGAFSGFTNQGASDLFVTKRNPLTGEVLWTVQSGNSQSQQATSVAVDRQNNIYVVGYTYNGLDNQPGIGANDVFVTRYTPSGTRVWTRVFGSPSEDLARGIAVNAAGEIFVSGDTSRNYYMLGAEPPAVPDSVPDSNRLSASFVLKLDANGNPLWTRYYVVPPERYTAAAWAHEIALDAAGDVYATGYGISVYADGAVYLAKVSGATGQLQWVNALHPSGPEATSYGRHLALDSSGAVYVTGTFFSEFSTTFQDNPVTRSEEALMVKYDHGGNRLWTRIIHSSVYSEMAEGLDIDASGNVFLSGRVYTLGANSWDYWAARYNSDGQEQWYATSGSPAVDMAFSALVHRPSQRLILVGNAWGNFAAPTLGDQDIFVATRSLGSGTP